MKFGDPVFFSAKLIKPLTRRTDVELILSRHAKKQMNWRKISPEDVQATMQQPEKIEDSIKGRKNAFRHLGTKYLKVTYVEEGAQTIIITAIDKRQLEEENED